MDRLVISLATNVGWEYVRPWVCSLRRSGYSNPVVLVTAQCEDDLYEQCTRWDVTTIEVSAEDLDTRHLSDPVISRHAVLRRVIEERFAAHFVLSCDVRDIVFQTDPFEYFGPDLRAADPDKLYVVSEEIVFDQDESANGRWGGVKTMQLFSSREREELRGKPSYNAGILCGAAPLLAGVMKMIYLLCFNSTVEVVDQAALNTMLQTEPYRSHFVGVGLEEGWAVHFAAMNLVQPLRPEITPKIEDGLVKTPDGKVFSILHQYDRSAPLKRLVRERLKDWDPR